MKRLLKKIAATTLIGTFVIAGLSSCNTKKEETAATNAASSTEKTDTTKTDADTTDNTEADSSKPDTWIADRTITLQAYVSDIGDSIPRDMSNTDVGKELAERTGIKVDIQYTPGEKDSEVMAAQLASGTIPDAIVTYLNDSTRKEFPILLKAAKDDMFADVSSYLADSKGYNQYPVKGFLPSDSYKNIVFREDLKGAVYLVPLMIDKVDRSAEYIPEREYIGGPYIQKSIAEALNITPSEIRTQEQFYDLLVKIKDGGFKDDNGKDVYPLGPKYWGGSVDALNHIEREYSWDKMGFYNITKDGEILHEAESEYAMKKVNYMRKLIAEGLANPEIFTMDGTRADEVSRTHNSAVIADVHNYMDIVYATDEWVPVGPLNDFTGNNANIVPGKTQYGAWAISSKAENPEEIFKFFDYFGTVEGQLLAEYGIEGKHYNMVDGKPILTDETLQRMSVVDKEYLIEEAGAAFGNVGSVFFGYIATNVDPISNFGESRPGSSLGEGLKKSVQIAKDNPRTIRVIPGVKASAYLSADGLEDVNAKMSLLNYDEVLVQAIFADSDAEAKAILDSFVAQLKSAGVDEFKAYIKDLYEKDPEAINFYND